MGKPKLGCCNDPPAKSGPLFRGALVETVEPPFPPKKMLKSKDPLPSPVVKKRSFQVDSLWLQVSGSRPSPPQAPAVPPLSPGLRAGDPRGDDHGAGAVPRFFSGTGGKNWEPFLGKTDFLVAATNPPPPKKKKGEKDLVPLNNHCQWGSHPNKKRIGARPFLVPPPPKKKKRRATKNWCH